MAVYLLQSVGLTPVNFPELIREVYPEDKSVRTAVHTFSRSKLMEKLCEAVGGTLILEDLPKWNPLAVRRVFQVRQKMRMGVPDLMLTLYFRPDQLVEDLKDLESFLEVALIRVTPGCHLIFTHEESDREEVQTRI